LRGQVLFEDQALGCLECHPPPLYSDLQAHDVGTATAGEKIGSAYDTPSLRGLYGSEPYFHDGSAVTLLETLTRPSPGSEHDLTALLTDSELQELLHYLLALPYER
jgi:cytochrome c peroxidase